MNKRVDCLDSQQAVQQMFVSRLEKMQRTGDAWMTIQAVLALLNDCEQKYAGSQSLHKQAELEELQAAVVRVNRKVAILEKELSELSWSTNPDRSGGAWTDEELRQFRW
jgi:hypothetical protein